MARNDLDPVHPGEVLAEDFLKPLGVTQSRLARHIGVTARRVSEIVRGKRSVSAETAWLLAQAFGSSPNFWLNLQNQFDLAISRPTRKIKRLAKI